MTIAASVKNIVSAANAALASATASDPFKAIMRRVIELNSSISTDKGEWDKYAEICNDALASGIQKYIDRCRTELWTNGLDQNSWAMVQQAATDASKQSSDANKLAMIMLGFLRITAPSHNADQWSSLRALARGLFQPASQVSFQGEDTRPRRTLVQAGALPTEMSLSYLIKRAGFPARYEEIVSYKRCHVEYFMQLDVNSADGSAFFIITHSQDNGGYVGLAKVDATNVGKGVFDHTTIKGEPDFAGQVVWWDLLDGSHPGGCNHPGNGGQVGPIVVLVGQDWTETYPVYGHVVAPVRKGSKVLFYDFSCLAGGTLPTMGSSSKTSNAYVGCLTTEQLCIQPGDDGEVSSINIEQGPDGRYYLIAGNKNQTVLWTSASLVPDIKHWTQIQLASSDQLNDGSSMLAWLKTDDGKLALYYVTAQDHGMSFRELTYMVANGQVVAVNVADGPTYQTHQSDMFGKGDWVYDNGSLYVGNSGGVALHGTYQSINDSKGPSGQTEPCIQVRAWYSAAKSERILGFIKTANTPNGHVEVHMTSADSGYQKPLLQTATTFGNESDGVWQLLPSQDLAFIKTSNTPNGHVEVHIASRASNYRDVILATATTFGNESDGVWQLLPSQDLAFIKTSNTPNGHVEVHIASRASNYRDVILATATTFGNESDGVWQLLPNQDLAFIKTSNTPNGHVEVHIASRASNYRDVILATATTFGNGSDGVWQLLPNQDLAFIKTSNTPNGHVEVHIASRASGYQARTVETATMFGNENDGVWIMLVS